VAEAMQIMRRHDIRRLPVVEDGQPVGIVSLGDLSASSEAGQLLADISASPPS
jgi:CBS domain-containing protein